MSLPLLSSGMKLGYTASVDVANIDSQGRGNFSRQDVIRIPLLSCGNFQWLFERHRVWFVSFTFPGGWSNAKSCSLRSPRQKKSPLAIWQGHCPCPAFPLLPMFPRSFRHPSFAFRADNLKDLAASYVEPCVGMELGIPRFKQLCSWMKIWLWNRGGGSPETVKIWVTWRLLEVLFKTGWFFWRFFL